MTPLSGSTDNRDVLRTSEAIVLVLPVPAKADRPARNTMDAFEGRQWRPSAKTAQSRQRRLFGVSVTPLKHTGGSTAATRAGASGPSRMRSRSIGTGHWWNR